jgi:hypothetical protein
MDPDYDTVVLEGNIKNAQTRALSAILKTSGIDFKYVEIRDLSDTSSHQSREKNV